MTNVETYPVIKPNILDVLRSGLATDVMDAHSKAIIENAHNMANASKARLKGLKHDKD